MRMTARKVMILFVVLGLAALAAGCSGSTAPPDDEICTTDEQCDIGEYCKNGYCTEVSVSCEDGGTCPDGMVCVDGVCVYDTDGGDGGGGDGDGGDGDAEPDEPDIEIVEPEATGDGAYVLIFGNVAVGETVAGTVRLRNDGTRELQIQDLVFELGTVDDFFLDQATTDSLPILVPPGEEASFEINYRASDGLIDIGVLAIISNDPDEGRVPIQLESEFKGTADIEVDPPALNFLDVVAGAQGRIDLTISNQGSGNAVLKINGIQLVSMIIDHFELVDVPEFPYYLNPLDELVIGVLFHPAVVGIYVDRVMIASDDPNDPQLEVDALGRGVAPDLVVDPSPVEMGEMRVGATLTADVTVTNDGEAPLTITGIGLTSPSGEFELSSDPADGFDLANLSVDDPQVLQRDESRRLTVSYSPVDEGSDQATLLIDSPDIDPSPREVSVLASGYISPAIEVDPTSIDFGDLHVRGSMDLLVEVTNVGGRFLQVSDVSVSGGLGSFDAQPTSLPLLAADETADIHVTFSPQTIGGKAGIMTLVSNDPVLPTVEVELLGNAIDPNIFVVPFPIVDFGNVYTGQTVEEGVAVRNIGQGPLLIDSIDISGDDFDILDLPAIWPVQLQPGVDILNFRVTYTPSAIDSDSGTVFIVSSDLDSPTTVISLAGQGVGCPANQIDCNGDPQDGCEVDSLNDENNCGSCDNQCLYSNGTGACLDGTCALISCNMGYANCDLDDETGCEVDLTSDAANCGFCTNLCEFDNASASCQAANCIMGACDTGYSDFDNDPDNGCECAEDDVSNLCDGNITDRGVLTDGAVLTLTGTLVPEGDEDWYTFTAPDNNVTDLSNLRDDYRVWLEIVPGSGNPYALDIYRNPNTGADCTEKGDRVCDWADVEYEYRLTQADCNATGDGSPHVCVDNGARYWIRVYLTGALVSCNPYTINITFNQ